MFEVGMHRILQNEQKKNTSISPVNLLVFSYSYVQPVSYAVAARATFLW